MFKLTYVAKWNEDGELPEQGDYVDRKNKVVMFKTRLAAVAECKVAANRDRMSTYKVVAL